MDKYNTEVEMCKDLTMLISGIISPTKHKYIPEVPRCSGNDHSDMLFIKNNGEMFIVEYKLNNPKKLWQQVERQKCAFGIINRDIKKFREQYKYTRIFQYTGQDWELEEIAKFIMGDKLASIPTYPYGTHYRESDSLSVYWWGYYNTESSLEGGHQNIKRLSFFELYLQAIENLQKYYNWQLDSYLVYRTLGFYSYATTKKYFNIVMNEHKSAA